jgi:hypothetical protein
MVPRDVRERRYSIVVLLVTVQDNTHGICRLLSEYINFSHLVHLVFLLDSRRGGDDEFTNACFHSLVTRIESDRRRGDYLVKMQRILVD